MPRLMEGTENTQEGCAHGNSSSPAVPGGEGAVKEGFLEEVAWDGLGKGQSALRSPKQGLGTEPRAASQEENEAQDVGRTRNHRPVPRRQTLDTGPQTPRTNSLLPLH